MTPDEMPPELRGLINKRLTLNLLIQGAATHTFLTSHHLVKDELDEIDPRLVPTYDRTIAAALLNYWQGDFVLLTGPSRWFWQKMSRPGPHVFSRHPLLAAHGLELSMAAKRHVIDRARAKNVPITPVLHYAHTIRLYLQCMAMERGRREQLVPSAKTAASRIWGIDPSRYTAAITDQVAFGNLQPPHTTLGKIFRAAAVGYSGVVREGDLLQIVARASCWPLLLHELVKGTAELVCLHGINRLDPETYRTVMEHADPVDYELWLMQVGGEFWRRFLRVKPADIPLAEALMLVALLKPNELERFCENVIRAPKKATQMIQ